LGAQIVPAFRSQSTPDGSLTLRRFGLETALAGQTGQISALHLCAIPGIITHWHTGVSE